MSRSPHQISPIERALWAAHARGDITLDAGPPPEHAAAMRKLNARHDRQERTGEFDMGEFANTLLQNIAEPPAPIVNDNTSVRIKSDE